jgi:hypothetical protein
VTPRRATRTCLVPDLANELTGVRWRWVAVNPATQAEPPGLTPPNPEPPSAKDTALRAAWEKDPEWGSFGQPWAVPSPTTAPTPTVKEAGAQYLKLVAPSNKAIAQYNAALEKVGREKLFEDFTAQDIRIVTRAASTLADANRAFGIGIQQAR